MKNENEVVQRIESCYVADDCIQIMVPYIYGITIFSQEGILFHYKEGSDFYINKYLEDERRKQFPYSNIPTHYSKSNLFEKSSYVNQIFEYDKPYIRIVDGSIIESYVVKDNNEALLINKVMSSHKKTEYFTRQQLEKLLDKSSDIEEEVFFADLMGGVYLDLQMDSEEMILKRAKEYMQESIETIKNNTNVVNNYLDLDDYFLKFIEQKVDEFDINNIKFEIPVYYKSPLVIVRTNGKDIYVQIAQICFVNHDKYKVNLYDLPVIKYNLEQLKHSQKIQLTKNPKIPLKLNPGITKEDLKEAKKMIELIKQCERDYSKLPKSCGYETEDLSPLAYEKLEKGPVLTKKRK